MKTRKRILGLMLVAIAATIFNQSCSLLDQNGSISDTDLALAQDEAYVNALYEDADNMVVSELVTLDENDYSTSSLKSFEEDVCYTVTVDHPDSSFFPKVVTIDFGDGCTVIFKDDTITRSGKIIVTITGPMRDPEAERIVTFVDFYVNGVLIEGTTTITNLGLFERNCLTLGFELRNGKATFRDHGWMTREANHVRRWIRHQDPLNDTICVTGSANGMNTLGEPYNCHITDSLVLVKCAEPHWRWTIASGNFDITNGNRGNMRINHSGNGCDGNVEVDKDGEQYNYRFNYGNRHGKGGGNKG